MRGQTVSARKGVVDKYVDGFRRVDHAQILSCLTDDVVWILHGYKTLRGKAAFDAEIQNDAFEGGPTMQIKRLIEEGDTVAATGEGSIVKKGTGPMRFVFCELFTFRGNSIQQVETFHLWLTSDGAQGLASQMG
jgi:ketosteroid isomerase-like protein